MGDLSISHYSPHQDTVYIQPTTHCCEDVLKTHNFFLFNLNHSHQHCLKCIFSFWLPHFSISAQVLNGHLTRFGSVQSNFCMRWRLWLLPQNVLIGQVAPVNRIPQDQLTCMGAAGEQPVWGRDGTCMSDAGQAEPRGGVRVRAPSLISVVIDWLTIDTDEWSNLVLVVWQTADLCHWYRVVGGNCQPVDHYKKEGTGFITALVFVSKCSFIYFWSSFSYWSPYPWHQLRSSSAALVMRLFLQNAKTKKDSLNQFVCKQWSNN